MQKGDRLKVPTFLKWAGGKKQLIGQLSPLLPKTIDTYYEPFVGGGAVFFYLKKNNLIKKAILMDTNKELINCYKVIRDKPSQLIKELSKLKKNHSKEQFYEIRAKDVSKLNDVENAARFIYLNKSCFNGLYRVNSKGQFNTPIGSYKNPGIFNEETIMEASSLLKGVILKVSDFKETNNLAKKGDFIYFDPPYYPLNKTSSFTTYTKDKFLEEEQIALRELFVELDKKACKVMLSNSNSPFINKIYKEKGYEGKEIFANRMINCDASKRGAIKELVITNY